MSDTTKPPADRASVHQDLTDAVLDAMDRRGLTQRALAREIGVQHQTLMRWLGGANITDEATLVERATRWLASLEVSTEAAAADPTQGEGEFIPTPTSEKILSALAYAKASGDMVAVYGAPGVGKTRAIRRFRASYGNVWLATITPASATVVPALEEVCESVGLRELAGGARRLSRAIQARVRDVGGLIVLDEAQHLATTAVEELRAIHDATGVGLALVGNETSYARLTGGARAAQYAQIYSRLGMRLYVPPPSAKDVALFATRWKVNDRRAIELLERVAQRPGGLRSVTKVLRLATLSETATPTWERVKAATTHLGVEE